MSNLTTIFATKKQTIAISHYPHQPKIVNFYAGKGVTVNTLELKKNQVQKLIKELQKLESIMD